MGEIKHGTYSTYINHGCRCDDCKRVTADYMRRLKATLVARLAADPTAAPHGSVSTYNNWGCRCEPCTAAHSARCKAYRAKRKGGAS